MAICHIGGTVGYGVMLLITSLFEIEFGKPVYKISIYSVVIIFIFVIILFLSNRFLKTVKYLG